MSLSDSQEKQKSPEQFESGDKGGSNAETKACGEAETGKDNYYESITKQARALKKARERGVRTETHKEFGTPTIAGDEGTLIPGGAPSSATITDAQRQALTKDAVAQGSAEQTGKFFDYKVVQENKSSFSLGMDYEDRAPGTRPPIDKLGDFMQAAIRRATDPEVWKAWAQGEINMFGGIGEGLNEAKAETKAAVAAGWKVLTDGTVVEFLSQPNAINAPVFKTVANAFDAMSTDPNAVNKAFESLGHVVMKASEGYIQSPDHEKGKVIGKVMFGMINPEGSTEVAEAAVKVANRVATHVDKAVLNTIGRTVDSIKEMAPDIALQAKQVLYDYIRSKRLNAFELESAGKIPNGYFDKLSGSRGDWPIINERPSLDVVQQVHENACAAAVGEMVTNGGMKQESLLQAFKQYHHPELLAKMKYPTADIRWLGKELGRDWYYDLADLPEVESKLSSFLKDSRTWVAELREPGKISHIVAVDGVNYAGEIMIRDPQKATRYEMTRTNFIKYWVGRSLQQVL